ncbi:MAG TPA: class IIb bacteriocin, lactobin A/cerein 7B family [Candidatus Polarisedimenticolia bacterium]|jgi:lactobin A/cerein 7B family class IIb bacteriocin|nr:class IIb bacteriocin, lactobin A/cerein 7B family [Candidatus Polarisedimenticolia bacterium]
METQLSNDELTQVNGGTGPDWGAAVKFVLIGVGLMNSTAGAALGAYYYANSFAASFGSSVPQAGDTPDPMSGWVPQGGNGREENSEHRLT